MNNAPGTRPRTVTRPTTAAPHTQAAGCCAAVIVTRDRPALLRHCLASVLKQRRPPDFVVVVDNASGPDTQDVFRDHPAVRVLRLGENAGGAGGFRAGIELALRCGADWLWLMDDDGRPRDAECLGGLLRTAAAHRADLVGALVVDVDEPERLSFPIRIAGRTRFGVAEMVAHEPVPDFAHLFNGALIGATLFHRIGLPDPRFFIRGDEVEFLFRARKSAARIVLDTAAQFLHPGSRPEIHPILGGLFYAVVPLEPFKQFHQFRNRAYIFRRYSKWGWAAADMVRYGYYFMVTRRLDVAGFGRWAAATADGWSGRFMRDPTPQAAEFRLPAPATPPRALAP